MTPGDQTRKEDETEPGKSPTSEEKTSTNPTKDPTKPNPLIYKFKFAPADPKNSFDFEDTADK